ncbi:uncharacterized protein LOC133531348 isoform X1 [Cydia pomonella]|uniref:uncharacterized protein LOC133531348 isoform X1 n=1 Tax=Cydia pomonella TaxID=82600 RepID=UPI002ADDC27C|nr:uncharacterized protein LOC133531348 isoform X1 [Cydia pomonella]
MHFAILCLITIPATMQAGPLPKLRYRPPRWNRLRPIKILQTSKEAFHIPESRRFDTLLHFEKPDLNSRKSFDDEPDMNEDGTINNIGMGQFTRKNGALKGDELRSLFGNDNEIDDNYIRSIFGKNDGIHLTKGGNKKHNNLLNIVEQLVKDEDAPSDQDGRGVIEVSLGLKRGLRRQGGLPPKLVYEFNELVD